MTTCPLRKHLGHFNHNLRLSQLHQCDQEMLQNVFLKVHSLVTSTFIKKDPASTDTCPLANAHVYSSLWSIFIRKQRPTTDICLYHRHFSVVALCFLMKPDRNVRGMMEGYYVCSSTHQFSDPQTELTIQRLS